MYICRRTSSCTRPPKLNVRPTSTCGRWRSVSVCLRGNMSSSPRPLKPIRRESSFSGSSLRSRAHLSKDRWGSAAIFGGPADIFGDCWRHDCKTLQGLKCVCFSLQGNGERDRLRPNAGLQCQWRCSDLRIKGYNIFWYFWLILQKWNESKQMNNIIFMSFIYFLDLFHKTADGRNGVIVI